MISASWCETCRRRHFLLADWQSLKSMVKAVLRDRQPFVLVMGDIGGLSGSNPVRSMIAIRLVPSIMYDFPAEHWKHLRSTNPVESTFATP